jgi:O-antigen ligase
MEEKKHLKEVGSEFFASKIKTHSQNPIFILFALLWYSPSMIAQSPFLTPVTTQLMLAATCFCPQSDRN